MLYPPSRIFYIAPRCILQMPISYVPFAVFIFYKWPPCNLHPRYLYYSPFAGAKICTFCLPNTVGDRHSIGNIVLLAAHSNIFFILLVIKNVFGLDSPQPPGHSEGGEGMREFCGEHAGREINQRCRIHPR